MNQYSDLESVCDVIPGFEASFKVALGQGSWLDQNVSNAVQGGNAVGIMGSIERGTVPGGIFLGH